MPSDADPPRSTLSIRARVIAAVVLLTGIALLLSGALVYTRAHAVNEQRVAAELERAIDEFEALATDGVDPDTRAPFAGPEDLLRVAMRRTALGPTEGAFAIVAGQIWWTAPDPITFRPENDPEFVAHVLPLAELDLVSSGALETSEHDYRYVVIPVRFPANDATGALVRVVDLPAEEARLLVVYTTYALVALGSLLLVALLIWVLVGRLLRPISWMSTTAARITDTDLSQRIPVRGSDDLSVLGMTINGMLDRLETALNGQRELLDDVGHELRTPLTIVRGHLELMDPADPEDVSATRALVMDELDRMRRLVDDLLTLAKAERPDFLTPEATDIARLTDETLAKATTLGERHWVLDELADVDAFVDPQRIAQAWLQLAANAVQYSEDGSTVAMGSRVAGDRLDLWVRDEGIGIADDDKARVLQRLERGGHAAAASGGTGLGLAIVASIVNAHRGRVTIDSEPGHGSRIGMSIPLTTLGGNS